jgi:hypothetical protein
VRLARARDPNLDIMAERGEELHQAFSRKRTGASSQQVRHMRLGDTLL